MIRNVSYTIIDIPMMSSICRQDMERGHIMATSTDARGNSLYSASLFETRLRILLKKEQVGHEMHLE